MSANHAEVAYPNSSETADRLGVSVRTIHRMVKAGVLTPLTKMPGKTGAYVFSAAEVERVADAIETPEQSDANLAHAGSAGLGA